MSYITLEQFKNQFSNTDSITNIHRVNGSTIGYIQDGIHKVRLYETDIYIDKGNYIILNTGGWQTIITKTRINDLLPIGYIYQKAGVWYYDNNNGSIVRYFDWIEIDKRTGAVLNTQDAPNHNKIDKYNAKILKMIDRYCAKINNLQDLPDDSSGDCLYCHWGDNPPQDSSHLIMHLKELYIQKSLILNALHFRGYKNPVLIYMLEQEKKNDRPFVLRAVKRYLKAKILQK